MNDHPLNLLHSDHYYSQPIFPNSAPQQDAPVSSSSKPKRRRRKKKSSTGEDGAMQKRKLSQEQVNMLEKYFGNEHKLETGRKDRLAAELGLGPRQVAVWFQNRRARWRIKKMEEESARFKAQHETAVLETSLLQAQLRKLKEELQEAQSEIQRLKGRVDGVWNNSPASSISMEAVNGPFFGEFGVINQGFEDGNIFGMEDNNNYGNGMDWVDNLYHIIRGMD